MRDSLGEISIRIKVLKEENKIAREQENWWEIGRTELELEKLRNKLMDYILERI